MIYSNQKYFFMKRFYFLKMLIVLGIQVSLAQNERAIVARWEVGDKQEYVMESTIYEITENGDTTLTSHGMYDFCVSVLENNQDGYVLKVDYPTSIYTKQLGLKLKGVGDVISINVVTGKDGSLIGVNNADYMITVCRQIIEELMKLPQMKAKGLEEKDMRAFVESVMSPERMIESFSKDIQLLLWPFGIELEPGYEYSQNSQVTVGESIIPVECTYYLAPQAKGQTYSEIYMETEYDSNSLAPFVYSFLSDIMDNIENKGKYDKDEFKSESTNYKIEVMDNYAAGIDDGSTIPFVSTHTRSSTINLNGKVQGKIQIRIISLKQE